MCVACNYTVHRKDHNFAWSRKFLPVLEAKPGETIHFECLDSGAGHFTRESTVADVATVDFAKVNPVTGPVFVEGAKPGDAVKITFRKFIPSGVGWTANIPGFGLLADQFPDPALHIWTYDAVTMAPALYGPKGRVPLKPFAGEIGLAPAEPGLHSVVPPRPVGGNLDIRDLGEGSVLYLPVAVEGGLFSIGDTHAAQGDGEVCGTAIESQMDVELTLDLVKGANLKSPRFTTPGPVSRHLDGAGYEATTGVGLDLMTAAREAVSRMIDLLAAEHGLNPVDAYMLLSVCGDLRISEIVDQAELGGVLLLSPHRLLVTRDESGGPVLSVEGLSIDARTPYGLRPVLEGVAFSIEAGETLCLAGESGSGKSLTALAIMRLLSSSLKQRAGTIRLAGRELTRLSERAMRGMRGGEVAMIFQEPMTSLNPVMTVGAQLAEAIRTHDPRGAEGADARARRMLDAIHIAEPARRMGQYPHELSGGMRQRVMIAMALSCRPKVLIADEPTTALDVTVQAQILTLMRELRSEFGAAILLITHDMGVVAEMADRVALLKSGRLVEQGATADIFERPREAYTRELLEAVPRLGAFAGTDGPPLRVSPLRPSRSPELVLEVEDLRVTYGTGGRWFGQGKPPEPTVKGVSFEIRSGRTLGLVGESGSGKSTIGKAVLGLVPFTGRVAIDGVEIAGLPASRMKPVRRKAQMIFQDPYASLDPRMSIGAAIAEPLVIHGVGDAAERRERVATLLERVRLSPDHASRYPHEFSGGQRQRICIARALALEPRFIVADESVSALEVSVRGQVLDLLLELQEELGLAYLFISHDMAVVERMSHDVAVMRGGAFVEYGSRRSVFETPFEDYTKALMSAVPLPVPRSRTPIAPVLSGGESL